jgi:hypothetical protein
MARLPVVERDRTLRPAASPVDTYVRPPTPGRSQLWPLVEALGQFDSRLQGFVEKRAAEDQERQAAAGEAAFLRSNRQGYAEAVRSGAIPAFASRHFVNAYKRAEGSVAGMGLEREFLAAYDQWPGKTSEDPAAFDAFLADFLQRRVPAGTDPETLRGLLPHLRAMTSAGQDRNILDRHNDAMYRSGTAHGAEIAGTIDAATNEGLGRPEGTDYEALGSTIDDIRAGFIAAGHSEADADKMVIDALALKAEELRDPEIMNLLDRPIPGRDGVTYRQTPYGQQKGLATRDRLEALGRQGMSDEAAAQVAADKAAKDAATRAVIEVLAKDPNAVIPEEVLAAGSLVDPEFRTNVLKWQEQVRTGQGRSDPVTILQTYDRMARGDAVGVFTEALNAGIFGNGQDLKEAWAFAQSITQAGQRGTDILTSRSVTGIMDTIRQRTAGDTLTNPFDPGGTSDAGLAAQHDFRIMVLQWSQNNLGASAIDTEKAIAEIGAAVLSGITGDAITKPEYSRPEGVEELVPTLGESTPFGGGQAAPAAGGEQPAAPGADPAAAAPVAPPQDVRPVTPPVDAAAFNEWWSTMDPDMQGQIDASARERGLDPLAVRAALYNRLNPAQPQTETTPVGAPPPDLTDAAQPMPEVNPEGYQPDFDAAFQTMPEVREEGAAPPNLSPISIPPPLEGEDLGAYMNRLMEGAGITAENSPRMEAQPAIAPSLNSMIEEAGIDPQNPTRMEANPNDLGNMQDDQLVGAALQESYAEHVAQIGAAIDAARAGGGAAPMDTNITGFDPRAEPEAARIAHLIGSHEGPGGYNQRFAEPDGAPRYSLVTMSINDVLAIPGNTVNGVTSTAAGRYQIIRSTMRGLMRQMGLTGEELFDAKMQDRMALQLMENRGLRRWQAGDLSDEDFAANLAKEWASLPNPRTGRSHYAGDGVNQSHVSTQEVLTAFGDN